MIIREKEGTSGEGKGGVDSRGWEGQGWALIVTAAAWAATAVARETTLNSLIIGVTFEEIALSDSGTTM